MAKVEYHIQSLIDGRWHPVLINKNKQYVLNEWNNHFIHCRGIKRMVTVEISEKVTALKLK